MQSPCHPIVAILESCEVPQDSQDLMYILRHSQLRCQHRRDYPSGRYEKVNQ
jgi:hypothetical protein